MTHRQCPQGVAKEKGRLLIEPLLDLDLSQKAREGVHPLVGQGYS
jgi:hypothetical protein